MPEGLFKNYIYPIATISGTIIGVGIFSLPYIASKVGIWIMLAYFLVLGFLAVCVHQFFGRVCLETPDFKRLPGFAKIYLGKKGETVAYISTILGLFGALLAYLIVGGEFLESLLSPVFGGNNFVYTILYFSAGTLLIYFGIKVVAKVEFWALALFFGALLAMFFYSQPFFEIKNLLPKPDIGQLFLPYGAILFSLWGASIIPEVEEMLGAEKNSIKKVIPASIVISIFVSLFFTVSILGLSGPETSESALAGLEKFLGKGVFLLLFFGVLTTFTSFISLGLTLKRVFTFDLGIKNLHAFIIACFFPLILFLLGLKSFIFVISFVGGVLLSIDGILILLMYKNIIKSQKSKVKNILIYSLMLVFVLGIIYEIIYFVR